MDSENVKPEDGAGLISSTGFNPAAIETYSSQFSRSSHDILSRIRLSNISQHAPPHKDAESATLSLPGQVPDWTPLSPEDKTQPEATAVDFGQDTVQLRMPGYNAETELRRQKFAESIANLEQPPRLDLLGFTAGHASNTALSGYFSRQSNSDLLDILKFADQLQPNLIKDILASVAQKHPHLPIFSSPNWNPEPPLPTSPLLATSFTQRISSRPRHGHTVLNPRMRNKRKAMQKLQKRAQMRTGVQQEEEDDDDDDDEDGEEPYDDAPPPTWPKPGHGLYAKLPLEDEDRAYMDDDNLDEAFAHFGSDELASMRTVTAKA